MGGLGKRVDRSGKCSSEKEGIRYGDRGFISYLRLIGIVCLVGRWEWEGEDGVGRMKVFGS